MSLFKKKKKITDKSEEQSVEEIIAQKRSYSNFFDAISNEVDLGSKDTKIVTFLLSAERAVKVYISDSNIIYVEDPEVKFSFNERLFWSNQDESLKESILDNVDKNDGSRYLEVLNENLENENFVKEFYWNLSVDNLINLSKIVTSETPVKTEVIHQKEISEKIKKYDFLNLHLKNLKPAVMNMIEKEKDLIHRLELDSFNDEDIILTINQDFTGETAEETFILYAASDEANLYMLKDLHGGFLWQSILQTLLNLKLAGFISIKNPASMMMLPEITPVSNEDETLEESFDKEIEEFSSIQDNIESNSYLSTSLLGGPEHLNKDENIEQMINLLDSENEDDSSFVDEMHDTNEIEPIIFKEEKDFITEPLFSEKPRLSQDLFNINNQDSSFSENEIEETPKLEEFSYTLKNEEPAPDVIQIFEESSKTEEIEVLDPKELARQIIQEDEELKDISSIREEESLSISLTDSIQSLNSPYKEDLLNLSKVNDDYEKTLVPIEEEIEYYSSIYSELVQNLEEMRIKFMIENEDYEETSERINLETHIDGFSHTRKEIKNNFYLILPLEESRDSINIKRQEILEEMLSLLNLIDDESAVDIISKVKKRLTFIEEIDNLAFFSMKNNSKAVEEYNKMLEEFDPPIYSQLVEEYGFDPLSNLRKGIN